MAGIVPVAEIPPKNAVVPAPDDPREVYRVCQELQALCDAEHGVGISAVQVGVPWKLFLVRGDGTCPLVGRGEYGYFANCDYAPDGDERVSSLEGCLSLRTADGTLRYFQVPRFKSVRLRGLRLVAAEDLRFEPVDCGLTCLQEGIVFQHEADHHNGILISEIGKEVFIF